LNVIRSIAMRNFKNAGDFLTGFFISDKY